MLGIDVGGTFTDFVAQDAATGKTTVWKSLSEAGDPVTGILRGLEQFQDRERIDVVRLGTTVATNALLERTVAPIAYVTTSGFKDVLFIQRGHRRFHYDLSWKKPKPLVKRRNCYELDERVDSKGNVVTPLDEEQVRELARKLAKDETIQAVAVALLFSYVNPSHEQRVKAIFAEEAPALPVSISYDVLPRWKEYERASTTVADAALKPIVSRQMNRVRDRLREHGVGKSVSVIRSNGGEMTLDAASEAPVQLALSGPTGGVVAAKHLANLLGLPSLVTFDMGGTSTDCATIRDGQETFTTEFEIEWGVPIQIPMIDVRTIGAGGGSIAWIDKGGMLRVGPESSRSYPGPACYGQGGVEPTVTDANVLLGRINPANFLGGKMKLDVAAAARAMQKVAEPLGLTREQAALAIVRIANNNMQGALRSVLIERGLDPRDFTLMGFGGAGPLHICELMDMAGIPRGLVPNHPGQQSAFGFTLTDARVDRQRTTHMTSVDYDAKRASAVLRRLAEEALADLSQQQKSESVSVLCSLEMRYHGQNYELELSIDQNVFDSGQEDKLWNAFHDAHEARFGFKFQGETVEIVNFIVTAIGHTPTPELSKIAVGDGSATPVAWRKAHFEHAAIEVPVFKRDTLLANTKIAGPALIEEAVSVTVIGPRHRAEIDAYGHIMIEKN
ncbi:MAG TPA: hydantoinase/oxoprolinase family protein [Roseiarcus sp.]|jgi:N-methylhydantoinase A